MIHIEIVGAGGWASVALWCAMAVGVPTFTYKFGRMVERDAEDETGE